MSRLAVARELEQHLGPSDAVMLLGEKARRSFRFFFRHFAWPALNPGVPYVPGWHIDAIADHLEAVHRGEIRRLIINMPFRMLKTTLVSVSFPAWEWVTMPHLQFLTSSYSAKLATRDAVDSRRVIESPLYQAAYGHVFKLVGDQNEKTRYENDSRGQRAITSTDSTGTGYGGNRVMVDDPISARDASSPAAIEASIDWWKGTGSTRLNDQERDAVIIVHQRLAARDLTGYLLKEQPEVWDRLVLPMRYERKHVHPVTSIGWQDPRREEGELLQPNRLSEGVVRVMEQTLGPTHTAAQLQQRPDPKGGVMFKVEKIRIVPAAPASGVRWVRGWDFAATKDESERKNDAQAYTAGVKLGYHEESGVWYVADVRRERFEPQEVEELLVGTARRDGPGVEVDFPQDPGQAGKSQAVYFSKKLAGYSSSYSPESGDKAVRATPFSSQVNAGNVCLVEGSWNQAYLDELAGFPGAAVKDQVDASSRAFNKITGIGANTSMLDYVKQKAEEVLAAEQALADASADQQAREQASVASAGWLAYANVRS